MIRLRQFAASALAGAIRTGPLCDEKVTLAWHLAVGPAVAKATTVRLDDAGVLHVMAADRHWYREVRRSTAFIHSRLEAFLGAGVVARISAIP